MYESGRSFSRSTRAPLCLLLASVSLGACGAIKEKYTNVIDGRPAQRVEGTRRAPAMNPSGPGADAGAMKTAPMVQQVARTDAPAAQEKAAPSMSRDEMYEKDPYTLYDDQGNEKPVEQETADSGSWRDSLPSWLGGKPASGPSIAPRGERKPIASNPNAPVPLRHDTEPAGAASVETPAEPVHAEPRPVAIAAPEPAPVKEEPKENVVAEAREGTPVLSEVPPVPERFAEIKAEEEKSFNELQNARASAEISRQQLSHDAAEQRQLPEPVAEAAEEEPLPVAPTLALKGPVPDSQEVLLGHAGNDGVTAAPVEKEIPMAAIPPRGSAPAMTSVRKDDEIVLVEPKSASAAPAPQPSTMPAPEVTLHAEEKVTLQKEAVTQRQAVREPAPEPAAPKPAAPEPATTEPLDQAKEDPQAAPESDEDKPKSGFSALKGWFSDRFSGHQEAAPAEKNNSAAPEPLAEPAYVAPVVATDQEDADTSGNASADAPMPPETLEPIILRAPVERQVQALPASRYGARHTGDVRRHGQ